MFHTQFNRPKVRSLLHFICLILLAVLPLPFFHQRVTAQNTCSPQWSDQFGGGDFYGPALSMAYFDDGSGPALYVAGLFNFAGTTYLPSIARWDGFQWSAVGELAGAGVHSLIAFDDGTGSALYAAGAFWSGGPLAKYSVQRWNGKSWSQVGGSLLSPPYGPQVPYRFEVLEGSLYLAGDFSKVGDTLVNNIARLDGAAWQPLGSGVTGSNANIIAVEAVEAGDLQGLCVGGQFTHADGTPAANLARWDGQSWSAVPSDFSLAVTAISFLEGNSRSTPQLCVAGTTDFPSCRIECWDGAGWTTIANATDNRIWTLANIPDHKLQSSSLFAGGSFTSIDGITANRIAKWNGSSWESLEQGLGGFANGDIHAFKDETSVQSIIAASSPLADTGLVAVGNFSGAEDQFALSIAHWDGSQWHPFTQLNGSAIPVHALAQFDDGSGAGPAIYAVGCFDPNCPLPSQAVARRVGSSWETIGQTNGAILAMEVYDDGAGPQLCIAGSFSHVNGINLPRLALWNGKNWRAISTPTPDNTISHLLVFDDGAGPDLFVAGSFTKIGSLTANRIATWDGNSWSALGSGFTQNSIIHAIDVFDAGNGPAVYVAGQFTTAGGIPANQLAVWDGTNWSSAGYGENGLPLYTTSIKALTSVDNGCSKSLYAAGEAIIRFDGSAFTVVGAPSGGLSAAVFLTVMNDGAADRLYAAGDFEAINGAPTPNLAKLVGNDWMPVGEGFITLANGYIFPPYIATPVTSLEAFDLGDGPTLYIGGNFGIASGVPSTRIAKVIDCPTPIPGNITAGDCIDVDDLLAVINAWGPCESKLCPADLTNNGVVDNDDLTILLANWFP